MTTTDAPRRCDDIEKRSGAAWYSGAGERYTDDESTPNSIDTRPVSGVIVPSGAPESGGFTPLGRPVVPDE